MLLEEAMIKLKIIEWMDAYAIVFEHLACFLSDKIASSEPSHTQMTLLCRVNIALQYI